MDLLQCSCSPRCSLRWAGLRRGRRVAPGQRLARQASQRLACCDRPDFPVLLQGGVKEVKVSPAAAARGTRPEATQLSLLASIALLRATAGAYAPPRQYPRGVRRQVRRAAEARPERSWTGRLWQPIRTLYKREQLLDDWSEMQAPRRTPRRCRSIRESSACANRRWYCAARYPLRRQHRQRPARPADHWRGATRRRRISSTGRRGSRGLSLIHS